MYIIIYLNISNLPLWGKLGQQLTKRDKSICYAKNKIRVNE